MEKYEFLHLQFFGSPSNGIQKVPVVTVVPVVPVVYNRMISPGCDAGQGNGLPRCAMVG